MSDIADVANKIIPTVSGILAILSIWKRKKVKK
jgi:hypothetical protein